MLRLDGKTFDMTALFSLSLHTILVGTSSGVGRRGRRALLWPAATVLLLGAERGAVRAVEEGRYHLGGHTGRQGWLRLAAGVRQLAPHLREIRY